MSKEQVDEIVDGLLNNRLELTSFVSDSLEQDRRVQELEEYITAIKTQESINRNANKRIKNKNKRYREAMIEARDVSGCCGATAGVILDEALEELE